MTHKYDHLREKAISLRRQRQMTLDEIVERLKLPRTTIYYSEYSVFSTRSNDRLFRSRLEAWMDSVKSQW